MLVAKCEAREVVLKTPTLCVTGARIACLGYDSGVGGIDSDGNVNRRERHWIIIEAANIRLMESAPIEGIR